VLYNSLTASLKASEIASDLLLIQATCATIVTRILLQQVLKDFYLGNVTESDYATAEDDVTGALASGGYSSLLQTVIFSRNATGNSTGLLRATANAPDIILPATYANGTPAMLGDDTGLGYPTALYP
jgi:osomolarity two-component system, sensor histidine kinase SLN1